MLKSVLTMRIWLKRPVNWCRLALIVTIGLLGGCEKPEVPSNNVDQVTNGVKLYTMDCGEIEVSDMSSFADDKSLDGKKETLANPCFLIRHTKGDLIWDVGFNESLADKPDGEKGGAFHSSMKTKLTTQLKQIDLKPSDIEFLAISHLHPDHSGNANLFADSTFIINRPEHKEMFSEQSRKNKEFFSGYSEIDYSDTLMYDNRHDIFGDGSAIVISMPGHTPGSAVLLVSLKNSGSIMLTGDLYTHSNARKNGTVPVFNNDRETTIKSRGAFEEIVIKEDARVIVQHSKIDIAALPKFPEYLD